jgi:NitT/TauT family transport system ATP-binding protein
MVSPETNSSGVASERGAYSPAVARNERILQVQNLRKVYPNPGGEGLEDLVVLDGISFDVREGEFVTIIGPSGSGKSTLLNIIAGLDSYDGGDVVVSGHRVAGSGTDIVMIFQEDALFPWLNVEDNVAFGLKQKGVPKEERVKTVSQYIEMVGLTKFAKSFTHQLSGGMKQRVAIARALAMNPRILLMDEPFGALDVKTRETLQLQVQEIHQRTGKTILFVTHDVREAASLGDRVIMLSHGPARIKEQYIVDLKRPRDVEDPALTGTIAAILKNLRDEDKFATDENNLSVRE